MATSVASNSWELRIETKITPGATRPGAVKLQFIDRNDKDLGQPAGFEFIPTLAASMYSGNIVLPAAFEPGALRVRVEDASNGKGAFLFFDSITMTSDAGNQSCHFPMVSWVATSQQARLFIEGSTLKPLEAHIQLMKLSELKLLRGDTATDDPRKGAERIYQYDTYCDLGATERKTMRPTLGGASHPYPRRLKTNRPKTATGIERNDKAPWLPLDEQFSYSKAVNFLGGGLQGAIPAVLEALEQAFRPRSWFERIPVLGPVFTLLDLGIKKQLDFQRFSDISQLFLSPQIALPEDIDDETTETLGGLIENTIRRVNQLTPTGGRTQGEVITPQLADLLQEALGNNIKLLRSHRVPKVLAGRPSAWHQDSEFGRQLLAGQNPCTLQALDAWPKPGWTISEKDVKGLLGGTSIQALLDESKSNNNKPTLFIVDYTEPFASYIDEVNVLKGRHLHAGRALLMLSREAPAGVEWPNPEGLASTAPGQVAQWLVPLAIELTDRQGTRVYTAGGGSTPSQMWLLAKMAFLNLDAVFHQLVSHWQRTHCVIEPFAIAMRRQLSMAHPVYKLMLPHFHFTLNINSRARGTLINAGGVIERLFTTGPFSMEFSSKWYGQSWTFTSQALPEDLKTRGLMKDGKMVLDDYPYADDGMQIWNSLQSYFKTYLGIYYKSDADVVADAELQAWWKEIKEEGHPDIKTGWPSLDGVGDLVFILTTMAWTASAHHAAVNFGQYDHSGFILNRSSIFKKAIPTPGSREYKELSTSKGEKLEKLLLEYVMDPVQTAIILVVLKLLSSHAEDETYLTEETQPYLVDPEAKAAHTAFVKAMKEVEDRIEALNNSGTKPSRTPDAGGMQYTMLLPSSGPGLTTRGIPYSVTI